MFLWSVLAALHPVDDHSEKLSKYTPYQHELKTTGIEFPTPISQIFKFEKLNNISINVFGFEKDVYPLHITKEEKDTHINLLLIQRVKSNIIVGSKILAD